MAKKPVKKVARKAPAKAGKKPTRGVAKKAPVRVKAVAKLAEGLTPIRVPDGDLRKAEWPVGEATLRQPQEDARNRAMSTKLAELAAASSAAVDFGAKQPRTVRQGWEQVKALGAARDLMYDKMQQSLAPEPRRGFWAWLRGLFGG